MTATCRPQAYPAGNRLDLGFNPALQWRAGETLALPTLLQNSRFLGTVLDTTLARPGGDKERERAEDLGGL